MEKRDDWFEALADTVTSGVRRVLEVALKDAKAELARRDEDNQSLKDHIAVLVIQNGNLVQENNSLKYQLSAAQSQAVPLNEKTDLSKKTQEEPTVEQGKPVPYEDFANLTSRLEELRTRNLQTEKSLADAIKLGEHYVRKNRRLKVVAEQWKEYGEKKSQKYDALKSGLGLRSTDSSASPSPQARSSPSIDTINARMAVPTPSGVIAPPTTPSEFASSPMVVPLNGKERLCPIEEFPEATPSVGKDQEQSSSTLQDAEDQTSLAISKKPILDPSINLEATRADLANIREDNVIDTRINELQQYIVSHWKILKAPDRKRGKDILRRGDVEVGRHLDLKRLPVKVLDELYTHVREVICRTTVDFAFDSSSVTGNPASEMGTDVNPSTVSAMLQKGDVPYTHDSIGIVDFAFNPPSVAAPFVPEKLLSSQTTQDDAAVEDGVVDIQSGNPIEEDDFPVFVSARSLKRKRRRPDAIEVFNDKQHMGVGGSTSPIAVKDEFHDSPPAALPSPRKLNRTETLDLDELGFKIATPRKSRPRVNHYTKKESIRSQALQKLRLERSTSDPGVKDEPSGDYEPYLRPFKAAPGLTSLGDAEMTSEDRANSAPADVQQFESVHAAASVLNTLDLNTRILPQSSQQEPGNKRRRKEDDQGVDSFWAGRRANIQPTKKRHTEDLTAGVEQHIQAGTNALAKEAVRGSPFQNPTPPTAGKSRSGFRRLGAQTTPATKYASSHSSKESASRPSYRASRTPLRTRPVEQLTLDHFKPNPAYNQGLDYAFVETVRDREARKCLPGCTKPECCGDAFRALAMAAPTLTAPRGLFDADDEDDEVRLLQNYMGGAYDAARIRHMPAGEKEELVLQARTRLLADMHGRHKQAYERRVTPPGFWRTDFPSTQETEKDREEARKFDRAKVEERWRDAMREGGRWIFRDE